MTRKEALKFVRSIRCHGFDYLGAIPGDDQRVRLLLDAFVTDGMVRKGRPVGAPPILYAADEFIQEVANTLERRPHVRRS